MIFDMRKIVSAIVLWLFVCGQSSNPAFAQKPTNLSEKSLTSAGVAAVDITPNYPVRLNGFGGRRKESEGITQRIWAKALAISTDPSKKPVLILTVDNLGVPDRMVAKLAEKLNASHGIPRENIAITATHTHTAPMLTNVAPTLFGQPIPLEHQKHIDQYTNELQKKLLEVSQQALKDLQPAELFWGLGTVKFAKNRRTAGGPVDHDLPLLVVKNLQGKIRALYVSYACHCVTLSDNKISGDWAGYAQSMMQSHHPGAVAMVSIGCGADANPSSGVTGNRADIAAGQGAEIATEVNRLLKTPLRKLDASVSAKLTRISLSFDKHPTRKMWEERAKRKDAVGHHARVQLARLNRGEKLIADIDYPIVSWSFGKQLAMVFLPGEVVVDYSLRLKKEFDPHRLWVNGYTNDATCYIPSERILKEGGYEGSFAMIYYDRPTKFAAGMEKKIVDTIHKHLGTTFKPSFDGKKIPNCRPQTPEQSLGKIRVKPGFRVELIASEPLVEDPVAIDFGIDGCLWVVEMKDYPEGIHGNYKPGGRIRRLTDTNNDGKYDTATIFLEDIPFPTDVKVWKKGILVCAAPDVLYAEDTTGDGKADKVEKFLTGFATHNYQARVNSLRWGLDNWLYVSGGLFGGNISSEKNRVPTDLSNRDFRIHPKTRKLEGVTGRSQQGRVRDDFGNWFGCDNSTLLRHYPVEERYRLRNRFVSAPPTGITLPQSPDDRTLYPALRNLQLFKLSGLPGRPTAVCGLEIYRDTLFGKEYYGNSFICEPVNLLVHRRILKTHGATFDANRATDEATSEFLASSDRWFRPVQVRTGPDGSLWVVDMYRHVIEHTRWIPKETLAQIDVRAGDKMGRIYRVFPKSNPPRPIPRLDRMSSQELAKQLASRNGTLRDLVQQMIVNGNKRDCILNLFVLAENHSNPAVRCQSLCTLDGLGALTDELIAFGLGDKHPGVRRQAIRLAETRLDRSELLRRRTLSLVDDADTKVRIQLANTLGYSHRKESAEALVQLFARDENPYLRFAVLSSLHKNNLRDFTNTLVNRYAKILKQSDRSATLIRLAIAFNSRETVHELLRMTLDSERPSDLLRNFVIAESILRTCAEQNRSPQKMLTPNDWNRIERLKLSAGKIVFDTQQRQPLRIAALQLWCHKLENEKSARLLDLLSIRESPAIHNTVLALLAKSKNASLPEHLLERWKGFTPALRSSVVNLLVSRKRWATSLLGWIQKKPSRSAVLSSGHRTRLLAFHDPTIERSLEQLDRLKPVASIDRLLEKYRTSLTSNGNFETGKTVFHKHCSTCHRLHGIGKEIGPDLAALSHRNSSELLSSILDPNRAVESRYRQYVFLTEDGITHAGMIREETATEISIVDSKGEAIRIERKNLEQMHDTGKSLMPDGLQKEISPAQMASLIAFLKRPAVKPKSFAGNRPAVVKPNQDGSITLAATNCQIYGNQIVFETPFQNIGYWHHKNDRIVWNVENAKEGIYEVTLEWACPLSIAGNSYRLSSFNNRLDGKVASTGSWAKYDKAVIGTLKLEQGQQQIVLQPTTTVRGALMDFKRLWLKPIITKRR